MRKCNDAPEAERHFAQSARPYCKAFRICSVRRVPRSVLAASTCMRFSSSGCGVVMNIRASAAVPGARRACTKSLATRSVRSLSSGESRASRRSNVVFGTTRRLSAGILAVSSPARTRASTARLWWCFGRLRLVDFLERAGRDRVRGGAAGRDNRRRQGERGRGGHRVSKPEHRRALVGGCGEDNRSARGHFR